MLGKSVKTDAYVRGSIVDADEEAKAIDFTPCIFLLRKVPNESDRHDVSTRLSSAVATR